MVGLRRTVFALLGVLATILAMLLVPAAALAQIPSQGGGTAITIVSAGPDGTGDPYDLTVYAADANTAAIINMTAHVYDSTDTDVADVPMTAVNTTNLADQQFAASSPIAQSSLPAGTYTVTVDADDGTSTDSDDTNIPGGTFSFSYTTTVSVTPSQTTVTQDSDSVSFSGTVMGQAPGGTAVPLTGVPVDLSIGGGATNLLENTDSNGAFSYSASGILANTDYNFSVASSSTYTAGNDDIPITTAASSSNMTVTANPTSITEGSANITFSGNVKTTGGTPIVGATVSMSINGGALTPLASPTDSSGNFSTVVDGAQATTYTFSITGSNLYSGASASAVVGTAAAATTMTMGTPSPATVTEGAQSVTFSGTVVTTSGNSPVAGATVSVTAPGGTPTVIGTTSSTGTFTWADTTAEPGQYSFSIPNDPSSLYSGTSATSTVTSTPAATTITAVAAPSTVTYGSTEVTFSGIVDTVPGSGLTAPVVVPDAPIYMSIGTGSPTLVTTTNSSGSWLWAVSGITATTTYTFSVGADTTNDLWAGSAATPVTVTTVAAPTAITATPTVTTVTQGASTVSFSGAVTVTPAGATAAEELPDATVDVSVNSGSPTVVGTTSSTGQFTYAPSGGLSANTTYSFSVVGTTLYATSAVTSSITAVQAPVTMSVIASPNSVGGIGPNQTVTFQGTLSTTAGSIPIDGAPISLQIGTGATNPINVSTGSNGDFSYQVQDASTGDYTFSAPATNLYAKSSISVPVGLSQAMTTMTLSPLTPTVTQGAQTVVFSGSLTGVLPGTTTDFPLANVPINLAVGNGLTSTQVAMTASNGTFTATIKGIAAPGDYNFSVGTTSNYSAATDQIQIRTSQATTRITGITMSPRHLRYGQKVTIKGVAEYRSGKSWLTLAGSDVEVKVGANGPVLVTTKSNGSFTATLPAQRGPDWSASLVPGYLIDYSSTRGALTIQVALRVKSFAAKLNVDGAVGTNGCLQVTDPYSRGPQSKIYIDYATSARGPWKVLGTLPLHNGARNPSYCRAVSEAYFDGNIKFRAPNAYYRADFATNYGFDGAVSQAVHSARTLTKITDYTVKPREVNTGGVVTISGRLWRLGKTWQPYGHRTIIVVYEVEQGNKAPYWGQLPATWTTSKNGYFTAQAKNTGGHFVAVMFGEYPGSKTDLEARSNGIAVSLNHARPDPPDGASSAVSSAPALLRPVMPGLSTLAGDVIAVRDDVQMMLRRHRHRKAS
jgi:hypothetical protein